VAGEIVDEVERFAIIGEAVPIYLIWNRDTYDLFDFRLVREIRG
jgi:hypothetical protein